MPGAWLDKTAEQIKQIVASSLERRIKDPRLGFVTITDVRLSGDGHEATVFYTVLGDDTDRAGTQAALRSATGLLRSTVGKKLGMKFTPTLAFQLDALDQDASAIEEALAKARAADAEVARQAASAKYAGEADPYRKPVEDPDE
ncbi:MAG: 30S ribosome-binding factor RbfA [Propionibacteriaceae bacterium]|jgi:ribosome-binding factor A|nr:30S ribosome-binding factor RbfA [Propionibacteriaceae bacterium]